MENEVVQTGKTVDVTLTVTAKDLWAFSMYHTNAGLMGIFNLLFTLAALYLLIFRWSSTTTPYRCLLVICVLVLHTVWQPFLLWTKAKKQAKRPAVKDPMRLVFDDEKLTVSQTDNQAEFTWEQMGLLDAKPSTKILPPNAKVIRYEDNDVRVCGSGDITPNNEAYGTLTNEYTIIMSV